MGYGEAGATGSYIIRLSLTSPKIFILNYFFENVSRPARQRLHLRLGVKCDTCLSAGRNEAVFTVAFFYLTNKNKCSLL